MSVPTPSWAFLWDLAEGFAYRGDGVGMAGSWSDAGVLARRPIADALRVFDLGDRRVSALAGLARKTGRSVERYSVIEHRSGGDRRVHCVVHSVPERSALSDEVGGEIRFLRGLSVDVGAAPPAVGSSVPVLGDRIAEALTPRRRYRAISDPDSLNLLYWHGPPAPRIAWMADNTADMPIVHSGDMPAAMEAAAAVKKFGPGRTVDLTVRFLTVDGGYEPFDLSVSMVDLDGGQAALLVVLTVG